MTSFLFKSFAFTEKSTLTLYQNVICLLTRRKTKRKNNDDRPITRSWNAFKKAKVRFYKYNCKLFTRNCLEMPGESVEKCVDRHQHSEVYFYTFRCLFIRLLLELLLLRRNAIQMSGNFNKCWMEWKKSRNIRLKCWKIFFVAHSALCTFKNAKSLKCISSILFNKNNKNATAWAKMYIAVKEWQQQQKNSLKNSISLQIAKHSNRSVKFYVRRAS